MTGLEVLYTYVASSIDCPQDAIVCFVHWEMIKSGYRCIGSGDEPSSSDKMTELLPADWSNNKELYSLRYKAKDTDKQLLLKAVVVSSTMIFNLMNSSTQQVSDLTVNIYDHLDTDQLHSFDRVFRDTEGLSQKVRTQLLPSEDRPTRERTDMKSQTEKEHKQKREHSSPLCNRHPPQGAHW
uniref:Proteasome inhibitor PI31 subunit n=1 Tax=Mola mola TaxID=94237 RepID=A0A3Q3WJ79_MOLML